MQTKVNLLTYMVDTQGTHLACMTVVAEYQLR
jgi:hypothetical protein